MIKVRLHHQQIAAIYFSAIIQQRKKINKIILGFNVIEEILKTVSNFTVCWPEVELLRLKLK